MSQLLVNRVKRLKSRIDLLIDLGVLSEDYGGGFEPVDISDYSDYNLPIDAKLILEIIGIGSCGKGGCLALSIDCCWDYEAQERWEEEGEGDFDDFCSQFPKISKKDKIIFLGCHWSNGFGYVINKNKMRFVQSGVNPYEYNSFLDFLEKYFCVAYSFPLIHL